VNVKTLIAAATLLLVVQPLLAQNKKVYRCEDGSGRVTYSDEACKGGAELKNDDARTEQQRKDAADVAKRDEKLGDKLARERLVAERSAPKPGAALIPYSAAEKAAKEPPVKKIAKKKKAKPPAAEKTQA
jgi:Domain of unknown function (DUF4124)